MEAEYQTMKEGEPRRTLKKGDDGGMLVKALLMGLPGLKGGSGNRQLFRGLTLRKPLGLQVEVLLEEVSPLKPVPEWMAVDIVAVWKIDYSAHGYLLLKPLPGGKMIMAKNGEVALRLQP
jgi:hypothetical protein